MDRGSNDGVDSNVFIVIAKHPDVTIDICGIDNHEIKSIPLATIGDVALTTSGEVIMIMHQCAHHRKDKTIHSSPQIEFYKIKQMIGLKK